MVSASFFDCSERLIQMDVVGLASFVPRFLSYISSIPKMGDMALGKRLRG